MRLPAILLAVAAAAVAHPAAAQDGGRVALGVQGGTTGFGIEGQFAASDRVTLRATADLFKYDGEFQSDNGFDYDGELDLTQGGVFADYHPFGNPFFVSGGAYFGDRKASLEATATSGTSVEIGNQTFTAAEAGVIRGEADLGNFAPFVGLGFNNTFTTTGRIGFKVLAGAAFGDDASVSLARVGGVALPPATQARLDAELRNEEAELQDDADDFSVFPVLQVGVSYRF
jgi:hypothetical protein